MKLSTLSVEQLTAHIKHWLFIAGAFLFCVFVKNLYYKVKYFFTFSLWNFLNYKSSYGELSEIGELSGILTKLEMIQNEIA